MTVLRNGGRFHAWTSKRVNKWSSLQSMLKVLLNRPVIPSRYSFWYPFSMLLEQLRARKHAVCPPGQTKLKLRRATSKPPLRPRRLPTLKYPRNCAETKGFDLDGIWPFYHPRAASGHLHIPGSGSPWIYPMGYPMPLTRVPGHVLILPRVWRPKDLPNCAD